MDVETIDGASVDAPTKDGHKVEHCLHVAIQAFTRDAVKDIDPISKAKIQSKNFTRVDVMLSSGGRAPTILAKAVVVLSMQEGEAAHRDSTVETRQEEAI